MHVDRGCCKHKALVSYDAGIVVLPRTCAYPMFHTHTFYPYYTIAQECLIHTNNDNAEILSFRVIF